ncbi:MAG: hypothetical protein ACYDCQ_14740 [Dehalococcoidia bacterium]
MPAVPTSALRFGFAGERQGTLSGKTLMLPELRRLLDACPFDSTLAQYAAAITEQNVLDKPTATTRVRSVRHLREWYALDPEVPLFRALRMLWDLDPEAQPLLALLCAAARNGPLRATAGAILCIPFGATVTPQMLVQAAIGDGDGRWNRTTRASIGKNAAASWKQSGHITGRLEAVRTRAVCRPAAVAYALLLGYLCGGSGERLFSNFWTGLLDATPADLHEQAFAASQRGWIDYRRGGGITDVELGVLLRNTSVEVTA